MIKAIALNIIVFFWVFAFGIGENQRAQNFEEGTTSAILALAGLLGLFISFVIGLILLLAF
ncbi:MAG: hypothetical protein K2Y28_09460 [Burkholderiaceae bacterium]|nr:hypothetical protein [Burkholderiaceae bacterium]